MELLIKGAKIEGDMRVFDYEDGWYDRIVHRIVECVRVFYKLDEIYWFESKRVKGDKGVHTIYKILADGRKVFKVVVWRPNEHKGSPKVKFSVKGPMGFEEDDKKIWTKYRG